MLLGAGDVYPSRGTRPSGCVAFDEPVMSSANSREAIYEELRERIADAAPSTQRDARDVVWATSGRRLGFARSPAGAIELFIVSEQLESTTPGVARHLEHRAWATGPENGTLGANRLLLPNEPHFDRVAAFICAELLLNGVDTNPAEAFRRSEELIDLALARGAVDSQALVGLCGEMLLLDSLISADPGSAKTILMQSWAGYRDSSRDLQLGPVGVEVKTTTKAVSEHHIQGPHQTEIGVSVGGVPETRLFLLSIGMLWLPTGHPDSHTLPSIVTKLVRHLTPVDAQEFLSRVRGYSGGAEIGYEHGAKNLPREFIRPFTTNFARLYDLTDHRIRIPRSDDLRGMDLVPESVQYRIRLPEQVNGTLNPVSGLAASAAQVLQDAGS